MRIDTNGCPTLRFAASSPVHGPPVHRPPVHGLSLHFPYLELSETFARYEQDLTTLKGIPLERLYVRGFRHLETIEPLRGMQLKRFYLQDGNVKDLGPLAGMPFEHLTLAIFAKNIDFSFLNGKRLTNLSLFGIGGDPGVVTNLHCRSLKLSFDSELHSYSFLGDVRGLESSIISGRSRVLDEDYTPILRLKELKTFKGEVQLGYLLRPIYDAIVLEDLAEALTIIEELKIEMANPEVFQLSRSLDVLSFLIRRRLGRTVPLEDAPGLFQFGERHVACLPGINHNGFPTNVAEKLGVHLARIDNAQEQERIRDFCYQSNGDYDKFRPLLGLVRAPDGSWGWHDGTPLMYTNFFPGDTSKAKAQSVTLESNGLWKVDKYSMWGALLLQWSADENLAPEVETSTP